MLWPPLSSLSFLSGLSSGVDASSWVSFLHFSEWPRPLPAPVSASDPCVCRFVCSRCSWALLLFTFPIGLSRNSIRKPSLAVQTDMDPGHAPSRFGILHLTAIKSYRCKFRWKLFLSIDKDSGGTGTMCNFCYLWTPDFKTRKVKMLVA